MNQTIAQQTLDHVVLFTLDVRLISGAKRVKSEDLENAKGVVLEEDDVLTLGSKKVFDPDRLRDFKRIKDQMQRECMKHGTAFLSGFVVPDSKADDLAHCLAKLADQGNVEIASLVANYQTELKAYCASRPPEWADTIRANAYTEAYLRSRMSFAFNAIKISAARDSGVIAANLGNEVGGLLGGVLGDIAAEAQTLQERSLAGKDKKTRKVLRPLQAAKDKLMGFAFLDKRVPAIASMIDAVNDAMPDDGPIEGADLALLWGITTILSTPAKALQVAEQYEQGGQQDFIASLRPRAVTVEPSQASAPVAQIVPAAPASAPVTLRDAPGPLFAAPSGPVQMSVLGARAPQATGVPRGMAALAGLRR